MTKGVVGQEQVAKVNFRKLIIRLDINHPDKKIVDDLTLY
jgi:hypothetical protein